MGSRFGDDDPALLDQLKGPDAPALRIAGGRRGFTDSEIGRLDAEPRRRGKGN